MATVAAYTHGDAWLDALLKRLVDQRDLFTRLLAEHLPDVRHRPLQATYLAWLDARAYGHPDPGKVALDRGRVWVNSGQTFGPGGEGHVRVNLATSVQRLTEVVTRLAHAWDDPASS